MSEIKLALRQGSEDRAGAYHGGREPKMGTAHKLTIDTAD